jgi:hypothetical protein
MALIASPTRSRTGRILGTTSAQNDETAGPIEETALLIALPIVDKIPKTIMFLL